MRNIMKRVNIGINTALLLAIAIFACACQPTPERVAVVYGGGLELKLLASPAPLAAYEAPLSWQETLDMKGSDASVEINAQVSVPDVTAFPVYKVKQTEFDVTRIESLVNYFTKGRDVIKDKEPTKAELEQQLIIAQKNNNEELIAELEEEIKTAPETVEPEVITDWSPDKSPSGSFLGEDGEYAGINATPDRFGYMKKGYVSIESIRSSGGLSKIGDVTISSEDAVVVAKNMLHELGIDYMTVGSLEKAQLYASVLDAIDEPVKEPLSKGYLINFVRNIDGVAGITDYRIILRFKDDFAYRAPLYPEEMQIYVDEAGKVQSFVWSHPVAIEEKITENVALLPFEDVKQRMRDILMFFFATETIPTEITRIELNMAIVDVKDHPGEALYVPAWFVYYTQTFYFEGEKEQQQLRLGLNAIDGGRVLEVPVDIDPELQQK